MSDVHVNRSGNPKILNWYLLWLRRVEAELRERRVDQGTPHPLDFDLFEPFTVKNLDSARFIKELRVPERTIDLDEWYDGSTDTLPISPVQPPRDEYWNASSFEYLQDEEELARHVAESSHLYKHLKEAFEDVRTRMYERFQSFAFWETLPKLMSSANQQYYKKHTPYWLLYQGSGEIKPPALDKKEFGSFLLKTYRRNILDNQRFPEPPSYGWLLPSNWFNGRIRDIIRTSLVVKYLDGVSFLEKKIHASYNRYIDDRLPGDNFVQETVAQMQGYYALQIHLKHPSPIKGDSWSAESNYAWMEIQIRTVTQDLIHNMLHVHYTDQRRHGMGWNPDWPWAYRHDEFSVSYLAHILHYVEGTIVNVRDRQRRAQS